MGRKTLIKNSAKTTEYGKRNKFKLVKRRDGENSENDEPEEEEEEQEEHIPEKEEIKLEDEWIKQLLNDYWGVRFQFEANCKSAGVVSFF